MPLILKGLCLVNVKSAGDTTPIRVLAYEQYFGVQRQRHWPAIRYCAYCWAAFLEVVDFALRINSALVARASRICSRVGFDLQILCTITASVSAKQAFRPLLTDIRRAVTLRIKFYAAFGQLRRGHAQAG